MKDRIKLIMESKHMTQQVFSDFLGINSATISGIFNGRTKPTINVVEAVRKKFPDISLDWLIFGQGEMYKQQLPQANANSARVEPPSPQVSQPISEPVLDFNDSLPPTPPNSQYSASALHAASPGVPNNSVRNTRPEIVREEIKYIDKPVRHITEIRVYYDDQTWESFLPSKK